MDVLGCQACWVGWRLLKLAFHRASHRLRAETRHDPTSTSDLLLCELLGLLRLLLTFSCLGYCMRILPLGPNWDALQRPLLRILLRGLGGWIPPSWLTRPMRLIHLPTQLVDLALLHEAALSQSALGALKAAVDFASDIDTLGASSSALVRHCWHDWLCSGIPHSLRSTTRRVTSLVPRGAPRPNSQAGFYALLREAARTIDDAHMWRGRLTRWGRMMDTPHFPCVLLRRAEHMSTCVAPLPSSSRWALVKAWLNGWCTRRRFQMDAPRLFCHSASDSIEHFTCCRIVRTTALRLADIPLGAGKGRLSFLLLGASPPSGAQLTRQVAFLHALYRARNRLRHQPPDDLTSATTLRAELRGILIRHPSLGAAFPSSLPLLHSQPSH